jgi:hypothetical protein
MRASSRFSASKGRLPWGAILFFALLVLAMIFGDWVKPSFALVRV